MKIIAGNWKMNGTAAMLSDMVNALSGIDTKNTIIICPPFTLLNGNYAKSGVKMGGQDCSEHESGAYTGEISVSMLRESGAEYVIVGHSERRRYHNETSEVVFRKASAANAGGVTPIICIGETLQEKKSNETFSVIEKQIADSVPVSDMPVIIAYEPVWAIGTGLIPNKEEIGQVHTYIAELLKKKGTLVKAILYGGSVNGANAAEIMSASNVGGVLVGGASLKSGDFLSIINASENL